jgi:catechol 2,3-dioxygenase-like lactoylglutathione lyase family enzyme
MTGLQHVGLTCSDLKRSEQFYAENFGLENVHAMDVDAATIKKIFGIESPAKIIFLKAGNSIIELFDFPEAKVKPRMGSITHIALAVSEPQRTFEQMKARGAETILIDKGNDQYTYFVKDPDGVLVELKENA